MGRGGTGEAVLALGRAVSLVASDGSQHLLGSKFHMHLHLIESSDLPLDLGPLIIGLPLSTVPAPPRQERLRSHSQ